VGTEFQASWLCCNLSLPRSQFNPGPGITRFVVDKVVMEQFFFFSEYFGFRLSVLLHQCSILTSSEFYFYLNDKRAKPGNLQTNLCSTPFLCTNSKISITLSSSPPNDQLCLQSIFTRRTSAYCLGPFRAVKSPTFP
jgi:hypothetical protein